MSKKCPKCKQRKSLDMYGRLYYTPDKKQFVCKTCLNKRIKERRDEKAKENKAGKV